jgi:HPt (histidine-containing phosphotransfer) domain-containing protein
VTGGTERLDPARVGELRALAADDPHFLPRLVTMFVDDVTHLVQRLRQRVADSDTEVVRRLSHTLRGVSRSMGAVRLVTLTLRFDAHLAGSAGATPPQAMTELERTLADMEGELAAVADELRRGACPAVVEPPH